MSLKLSQRGLVLVEQAIAQANLRTNSSEWLVEASRLLEPSGTWRESGPYAYGYSPQTWERFLQRKAIRDRSFNVFCRVLGLPSEDVAESNTHLQEDWGEAPDVPTFHGRERELQTLEQWILKDRVQLVTIVGLAGVGKTRLVRGGIGKTDLSLQLAHQVQSEFDCLIWRRLINAPPLETLLTELIEFVAEDREAQLAETADGLITQLLRHLRQRRCLLILDNAESILQGDSSEIPAKAAAGAYRAGYSGYEAFFRQVGETRHQSCLLLTSRVKPQNVEAMEGVWPVRSLELGGVDTVAGQAIVHDIGHTYDTQFRGSEADWNMLVSFYGGNPLALEAAARQILRRFDGSISQFLEQNIKVFGKIRDLLSWHFERLSEPEKEIMYWLAINRGPVSVSELSNDVLSSLSKKHVPETLDALERHFPLEQDDSYFTLPPALMEYTTERLIETVCRELQTEELQLFNSHALIKASANKDVRNNQIKAILQPIIEKISLVSGSINPLSLKRQLHANLSKAPWLCCG